VALRDLEAVEIVLRMARRIRELSAGVRRSELEKSAARDEPDWLEAEWEEPLTSVAPDGFARS
jgi:hypothetical protein